MKGLAGTNAYLYLEVHRDRDKQAARSARRDGDPAEERHQARAADAAEERQPVRPLRWAGAIPRLRGLGHQRHREHDQLHQRRRARCRRSHRRRERNGACAASRFARRSRRTSRRKRRSSRRASRCSRCSSSTRWRSIAATTRPASRRANMPQMFEEEYNAQLNEVLTLEDTPYNRYLKGIEPAKTHNGYFSIDKKTKRLVDPDVKTRGETAGEADDVDAYDLILRDKERLLSFDGAGAVHLLALRAARRLGQPERLRHLHAQAQRQHHFAPAGSRARHASVREPEWRPDGRSGHRASGERADGRGQRELQGFRRRLAEGHQRVALGPPAAGERGIFQGQGAEDADRRREGDAADGEADRALPGEERLHRRPTSASPRHITRPRRKARWLRCRRNWSPTRSRSSS